MWKKNKRLFVDSAHFKQDIMAEIFGVLREAGIDVEAALRKSQDKSSCASKEVEKQLPAPADQLISPPVDVACRPQRNACSPSLDEVDTFEA